MGTSASSLAATESPEKTTATLLRETSRAAAFNLEGLVADNVVRASQSTAFSSTMTATCAPRLRQLRDTAKGRQECEETESNCTLHHFDGAVTGGIQTAHSGFTRPYISYRTPTQRTWAQANEAQNAESKQAKRPQVLIVGGTGKLGRHLTERCGERGFDVTVMARHIPDGLKEQLTAGFNGTLVKRREVAKGYVKLQADAKEESTNKDAGVGEMGGVASKTLRFVEGDVADSFAVEKAITTSAGGAPDMVFFCAKPDGTNPYSGNNAKRVLLQGLSNTLYYGSLVDAQVCCFSHTYSNRSSVNPVRLMNSFWPQYRWMQWLRWQERLLIADDGTPNATIPTLSMPADVSCRIRSMLPGGDMAAFGPRIPDSILNQAKLGETRWCLLRTPGLTLYSGSEKILSAKNNKLTDPLTYATFDNKGGNPVSFDQLSTLILRGLALTPACSQQCRIDIAKVQERGFNGGEMSALDALMQRVRHEN